MPATSDAALITWSREFPAVPQQISQARHFLAAILTDRPVTDDAVLCLSELASNAVAHSHSGHLGGHFQVRAGLNHGQLRVEVTDQGGPWQPRPDPAGLTGRGLLLVDQLATTWGRQGDETAWTVWFQIEAPSS